MSLFNLKKYANAEERQKAFEQIVIEIEQLKTPEDKYFCIPQIRELLNIYHQAEEVTAITNFLFIWMEHIRKEQAMTLLMNVSYLPDVSKEYRQGRADGLRVAESTLGLLAFEHGIDLTKC